MKVYKAPEDTTFSSGKVCVFLAGSIENDTAEKWQDRVPTEVGIQNVDYFNPRRDDWDSTWVQSIEDKNFSEQVNWELDHLDEADIIFIYFSPDTKSPISLLELGLYAFRESIICVCPDGFWRKGNIEIVCDRFGLPLYNSFEEGIQALKTEINLFIRYTDL